MLTGHCWDCEHDRDEGHKAVGIIRWTRDDAKNQNRGEQDKRNLKQQPINYIL